MDKELTRSQLIVRNVAITVFSLILAATAAVVFAALARIAVWLWP